MIKTTQELYKEFAALERPKLAHLRVGSLPPTLETIAEDYALEHAVVALDAILAYTFYTREKLLTPQEAYEQTITLLHDTYRGKQE